MKNLIKIFLIITFTIFAKEILLGLISENLPLSWPGKVFIAPIFSPILIKIIISIIGMAIIDISIVFICLIQKYINNVYLANNE